MQQLNLPDYQPRLEGENIWCQVRKKWIFLTPEEWVRQHFIHLLVHYLNYPAGLFRLEHDLSYFKNKKRSDISVFDRDGSLFLLVECKAPSVALNEKVLTQAAQYNKVLDAQYVAISNGMKHFVWEKGEKGLRQLRDFPAWK